MVRPLTRGEGDRLNRYARRCMVHPHEHAADVDSVRGRTVTLHSPCDVRIIHAHVEMTVEGYLGLRLRTRFIHADVARGMWGRRTARRSS